MSSYQLRESHPMVLAYGFTGEWVASRYRIRESHPMGYWRTAFPVNGPPATNEFANPTRWYWRTVFPVNGTAATNEFANHTR